MTDGVFVAAYGERALAEARALVRRVGEVWPDVACRMREYDAPSSPLLAMSVKVQGMKDAPFDRTLFLDADTWVVEPVPEVFETLERFDVALAHAPWREVYDVGVPLCFPEHNGGVVAFRRSCELDDVLARWERQFLRDSEERTDERRVGYFPSQASLRHVLYDSDLRVCTLPPEYNWRGTGYVHHKVRIVHKRPDPRGEARRINSVEGPRVATLHEVMAL